LAISLSSASETPLLREWGHFARSGTLSHLDEQVSIANDSTENNQFEFKLRYTRTSLNDKEILWANSRTCPAIKPLLRSMRDIQMPKPQPFGIDDMDAEITLDGAGYVLDVPSNFANGRLTISSNVGSPLATWIDGALKALDRCWSKVELRIQSSK
jgi:hypothetical protein